MIYPSASVPPNETERLEAVQLYAHLPLRHQIFQAVIELTAAVFGAPMSIMSIVEATQVQYPGSTGLVLPERMARLDCICSAAVYTHDTTIFHNLQLHPCPWVSPQAQAQTSFVFYAGTPLLTEHDFAIGTLCILDQESRPFAPTDQELLRRLARLAMYLLDLHRLGDDQSSAPIPCWEEIEDQLAATTHALTALAAPTQQPERSSLVEALEQHLDMVYLHASRPVR
ncbi:GAF domain-containing protein [Hymenobacter sp. NST-14]|uniref:GAF domain-containing protein n=1 Tax=Hymenobacter piscis TaxID=2839984 RepID=UPI001C0390CA|nr:GAF domain-containing protein [Hymenobacter piscis]MBT9393261.1 GAF domain-containing protein [Hymenobacter piscis]